MKMAKDMLLSDDECSTVMLTSGMMRLAKLGVINGRRKQINRGKIVTTFAMGIPELYEFIDYNPGVAVMDGPFDQSLQAEVVKALLFASLVPEFCHCSKTKYTII